MFDFACTKILLNVLHNTSLTDLLPWQHTGFQTSPILNAFLAGYIARMVRHFVTRKQV